MSLPLPFLINFIEKLISQGTIITFDSVGLIFYITALILSKTTKCIIIWHWWDIIILIIPGIIFPCSFYMVNNSDGKKIEFINNIALNILFLFSFTATIVLSIIAILMPVFIVLFIGALNTGKKDRRYKYGRKGNQNIIIAGIIASIAALLIGSLIKDGEE